MGEGQGDRELAEVRGKGQEKVVVLVWGEDVKDL